MYQKTNYRPRRAFNKKPAYSQKRPNGAFRKSVGGIDVSKFINTNVIHSQKAEKYTPTHIFSDMNIDDRIKQNIARKGFTEPTPIQDQSIPHILAGKDVVGIANTGTGKTGAFLIPLLDMVVKDRNKRILIIVPTRELAQQIEEEFRAFAYKSGFLSVCAVGGMNIRPQLRDLRQDPYFVIGTPGRLKDLIERKALRLSTFDTVVLDEADRMLDMGFIHDMKFILSQMTAARQTLFFTATLSREIESLIGDFLTDPVRVSVKTGDTAKSVHQDIVRIEPGKNKADVLHDLLVQDEFDKVLVFGRTKHGVEKLSTFLQTRGIRAESIHGNKTQNKRQKALDLFRASKVRVLVATDVAARGIDVADISHVINFDIPTTYEDYIHRIGRTGRAGKRGKALTFIE